MKQKVKSTGGSSPPPRALMATTRPSPGIQGNVATLCYLSPLFFSCTYLFTVTVALLHACIHACMTLLLSGNAWGLRGTACPGSSCSAILPIIKNGVQYDFSDHLDPRVTGLAAFRSLLLFHWSSWC